MISYKGAITEDLITTVLQYIESRFKHFPATARVRRKVVSVLVEAMQNIFHHGEKAKSQPQEEEDSTVMVYRREADYLILAGNRVESGKAFELKERIDRINSMSRDELNANYRRILETRNKSSASGSGVGMIDIARRTGQQIEFTMEKVEGNYYFCSMQIKIAS